VTAVTPDELSVAAALDTARGLVAAGIPLFLAYPDATAKTGFRPSRGWQRTEVDPAVVDQWQPGLALCAVMGHGLDLIDIDPRNGGDIATLGATMPLAYARAATPSGGTHLFVASLGVGSRDNVAPGIDVKGGTPDGSGRGFAFLAPTVRASVVTGELGTYTWEQPPDGAWCHTQDSSGSALAARIRELQSGTSRVVHAADGLPEWWLKYVTQREPQDYRAALRAIGEKLEVVKTWTPGDMIGFRTALLTAAYTLGGYVGGEFLDEDKTRAELEEAVCAVWGTPDTDDELWIQQGLDDGALAPFSVFTPDDDRKHSPEAQAKRAQREDPPPPPEAPPPPPDPPWSVYGALGPPGSFDPSGDSSDQGLAKEVAARMFWALRYASDAGLWVRREQYTWVADPKDLSGWIVAALAEIMPPGATPVPQAVGERTEAHWQAVRRALFMSSAGSGKVARKLRDIVMSDHPAALSITELDSNPEVLWAGGVPWDLRASGDVPTPAYWIDPNTPHLLTARCAPDLDVPTPAWDAFLLGVLPDPEVRAWALRVLSVALTGYPTAVVPMLYGRERSGKTSLIEFLLQIVGSYGHAANAKLLGDNRDHDAIIYDLKGRRLSFIDEGPKRGHDATERLKQLTGGGSMTARPMNGNPVTFAPTHTLVMTTNNEPTLTDPALRARVRLIPCNAPEDTVEPLWAALNGYTLTQEAPGILAAMMREAAGWLADRNTAKTSAAPISIRGMAEEAAQAQDPVREWVENCTVPAEPGTPGRVLYNQFAEWHQRSPLYRRMAPTTETLFGRTLSDMGYPAQKTAGKAYRPLAVLSGPNGVAPWEPMPSPWMVRGDGPNQTLPPAGAEEGGAPGGSVAGSGGLVEGFGGLSSEPAKTDKPRSPHVFDGTVGGLEGFSREEGDKNTHTPPNNPGKTGAPTLHPPESTSKPPVTSENAAGGYPPAPLQHPPTLLPGLETLQPSRRVTNTAVARLADERGITKAEARAILKEAKRVADAEAKAAARLAAIADAAGEILALPVVVDAELHVLPVSVEQAAAVVRSALARTGGGLTVDVETTGYPIGHVHYGLRTVQLGDEVAAAVFHPIEHAGLIDGLLAEADRLHAFSATADLVPLAHAGLIDIEAGWDRMVDTVIAAKLADPASTGNDSTGLKEFAPAVLGSTAVTPTTDAARTALFKVGGWLKETEVTTPIERSGWAQVDSRCATMARYAAADVIDTAALARVLPEPTPAVLARERLAQRMTARVTDVGVALDADHVAELTTQHTAALAQATARVCAFGLDNPGSDAQVGQVALRLGATLPATKTGRPSVAKGALEPLAKAEGELGAFAAAVLEHRHHETALSLFLRPYAELCRGDGRARPTIYTLGTDTGRMSCVRPNLQQLSRVGGIRACITADPGQLLISADFSGVELRVAAALSGDATLRQFIADGRDLHWEVARQVFGSDATKDDRYMVKRGVFGRIYGGAVPTLAAQMGTSQSIAASMVDSLDAMLPTLSAWSRMVREGIKAGHTKFETGSGRVIHLPRRYPHKGPNYCIQGTARELLVDALVRWRDTPWGHCTLLPVHDELVVAVPEAEAEQAVVTLVECMRGELSGVPIVAAPAESGPSFAWADAA
jgi:P4 family phage/plasmid primase-like protien